MGLDHKIKGEYKNSKDEKVYPVILVSCTCGLHKSFEFDESLEAHKFAETHKQTHFFRARG